MQSLLLNAIDVFFRVLYFLVLIRIILSWVPSVNETVIGGIINGLTEPILGPVRHMVDKSPIGGGMMLDFSPIIALFILNIVKMVLSNVVLTFF